MAISSAVVSTCRFKLPVVCFTLQLAQGATIGGPEEEQTHLGTRLITYRIGLNYYFELISFYTILSYCIVTFSFNMLFANLIDPSGVPALNVALEPCKEEESLGN